MFTYHTCTYNCLPEDELLGSKHVEDTVKNKLKYKFNKGGLYHSITLQCMAQKKIKYITVITK